MAHVKSGYHALRTSTAFITFVISYAIYTDAFLYAAIVPVAPFALEKQVDKEKVQVWVAILLGSFGIGCFVSSGEWICGGNYKGGGCRCRWQKEEGAATTWGKNRQLNIR